MLKFDFFTDGEQIHGHEDLIPLYQQEHLVMITISWQLQLAQEVLA